MRRAVRLAKCQAIETHCAWVRWTEKLQRQRMETQSQQEASRRKVRSHTDGAWARAGVLLRLQKQGEAKGLNRSQLCSMRRDSVA